MTVSPKTMDILNQQIHEYEVKPELYHNSFTEEDADEDEMKKWPETCSVFEPGHRYNSMMGSRPILIRKCYNDLESLIRRAHRNISVILGNKGIGKRTFIDYLYMKGVVTGDTFMVRHDIGPNGRPASSFYYPGGVVPAEEHNMAVIKRILAQYNRGIEDTVVLCQVLPPGELIERFESCLTFIATSDNDAAKTFYKSHKCNLFYMDIWNKWEIVQGIHHVLKFSPTEHGRVGRMYRFNPFIRYYHQNYDQLYCGSEEFRSFMQTTEETIKKSFESDHGMIMRAAKFRVCEGETTTIGSYYGYEFATPYMFYLMCNTLEEKDGKDRLKIMLNYLLKMNTLTTSAHDMIQTYYLEKIAA